MLNRRHVRAKVMQVLYVFENSEEGLISLADVKKLLKTNMDSLHKLYLYNLFIIKELGDFAKLYHSEVNNRYIKDTEELRNSLVLAHNPIIEFLTNNKDITKNFKGFDTLINENDDDIIRKIFTDLRNQTIFDDYIAFHEKNPKLHLEILQFVLKHYLTNHSQVINHFEERFFNFMDDKKVSMQMANKTLQNLYKIAVQNEEVTNDEPLLLPINPNEDEVTEFANDLVKAYVIEHKKISDLVIPKMSKWEINQVPVIDKLIVKLALTEFLYFPSIPVVVTINEYVEVAKNYSTPNSKKFVNGVLDRLFKELIESKTVEKTMES